MSRTRTIIIDGVEIQTILSAVEIASLPIKNAELQQRIEEAIEINKKIIEEYKIKYGDTPSKLLLALETQSEILKGDSND